VLESTFALVNDFLLGSFDLGLLKHLFSLQFFVAMHFTDFVFCVFVFLSVLKVIKEVVPSCGLVLKSNAASFISEVRVSVTELSHRLLNLI